MMQTVRQQSFISSTNTCFSQRCRQSDSNLSFQAQIPASVNDADSETAIFHSKHKYLLQSTMQTVRPVNDADSETASLSFQAQISAPVNDADSETASLSFQVQQVWLPTVQWFRSYLPDKSATDGQTDNLTPIYLLQCRQQTGHHLPPMPSRGSSVISGAAWSGLRLAVAFKMRFRKLVFES